MVVGPLAIAMIVLAACTSDDGDSASGDTGGDASGDEAIGSLPEEVSQIIESAPYQHARWSWYVADTADGHSMFAQGADQMTLLGSTTKLFTTGTYLDTIGSNSTLETPVYAVGSRSGTNLDGDLVLVGSGDFILGSRGVDDGEPQFAIDGPDHVYYYASPTAELVEAEPLAGLDALAEQVAAAGITSVSGDVLVDDRLWDAYETKEGVVTSVMVNDNLLDVEVRPGAAVGDPAILEARPETAFFDIVNEVTTSEGDGDAQFVAEAGEGNQVIVSGQISQGSDPLLAGYFTPDPAAYARALFIEALERAGVSVTAPVAAAETSLPDEASYIPEARVAALESPSAAVLSFLINKISHNRGAETLMCLLAVEEGSRDCEDGLAPILETVEKAGIDTNTVFLIDGEGSDPNSATPRAMVEWLTWMNEQPWADAMWDSLPVIDDDGNVRAKSGTSAAVQPTTGRLYMPTQGEAGYIEAGDGGRSAVALYMNNGLFDTPQDGLAQTRDDSEAVLLAIQSSIP